jgi:hypothetical protein
VVVLWNFELFTVDRILRFEVNFVLEILCEPQVLLVDAESVLVFAQYIQVAFMKFLWNLEVASPSDFFSGQSFPLHFRKAVVDVLANRRDEIICEWYMLILFHLHYSNYVISFKVLS